ncbi:MAG TPA: hypothetical protein DCM08_05375 [Microscillaceae bacterium]|nr:hypothetical protein [Microscillaceae bacterium]
MDANRWMQTTASSLLLLGLMATGNLQAQTTDSLRQSEQPPAKVKFYNVYISRAALSGSRTPYLLNFEGILQLKGCSFLALRAGLGYWRPEWSGVNYGDYNDLTVPVGASYLITGPRFKSAGEFGLMYTLSRTRVTESFFGTSDINYSDRIYQSLQATIGYRYQRPTGGFFFKFLLGINLLGGQSYYNSINEFDNDGLYYGRGILSTGQMRDFFGSLELSVGWSIRAKRK